MKNKHNFNWGFIFIFCINIIPFKSVNAQFGNNFCFHETSIDYRSMVKQPGIFMASDTMLKFAFTNFDPIEYLFC
jgi:hypothetical protein